MGCSYFAEYVEIMKDLSFLFFGLIALSIIPIAWLVGKVKKIKE